MGVEMPADRQLPGNQTGTWELGTGTSIGIPSLLRGVRGVCI